MSTPITDAAEDEIANDDSIHIETELEAMANFARLLETDRAALMEAVDTLTLVIGLTPIKGNLETLQEAHDLARSALTAARANFPTP